MKKINFIQLLLCLLILGCKNKEKETKNHLLGEWSKIEEMGKNQLPPPPPSFYKPFGIGFSKDKIEYFNGFQKYEIDTITGKLKINYKGTFTDYEIRKDSIFIQDPFSNNWRFDWKIKRILKDTLVLTKNDTSFIKLKRIVPIGKISFDQIVFSRSGCYGYCPIIDISVDNNNNVYFQGEGYVKPLGFYKAKIDSTKTNLIFSKFGKANINSLTNEYAVGHTDDESITTTFIKDNRIVKTIYDYGKAGPNELVWAYVPIENLYNQIKLENLPVDEPFYPKLHYYTFEKDSLILRLEKSESFYLWTEIKKSQIVNEKFKPKYSVGFKGNDTYWGSDPNEERKHQYRIDKIESDGKLFRFSFKDHKSVTYDLGYNFVERNFNKFDFKKKTKYD